MLAGIVKTIPSRTELLEKLPPPPEAASDSDPIAQLPMLEYEPYSKAQRAFHESMAKYKWLRGGLGSGKTRSACEHMFLMLCTVLWETPCVALIGSQTYRHLMDDTVPVLRQAFPSEYLMGDSFERAFRRQDMNLYLKNGTILALRTAHNKKYEDWRGPQYAAGCLMEGRNFPNREAWKVLITRLRWPDIPEELLQAWDSSTTNGLDWQYDEFHGKYRTEKHADFLMLTKDNPHLPSGYYEDLKASLDEDDARQELFGEFIARTDQVYRKLSRAEYPLGNVVHLDPDPSYPTEATVDWGYRNPRVHLIQTHKLLNSRTGEKDACDVTVGEWRLANGRPPRNRDIGNMIDWFSDLHAAGWNIRRVFCDPAGSSANDQSHLTSVERLRNALKDIWGRQIDVVYPKRPWQRSIATGESAMRGRICDANGDRRYLWSADRDGELDASNSFEALQALRFPEDKDNQPQKDVSLKDGINDHDGDAARYRVVMLYGRDKRHSPIQIVRAYG